MYRPAFRLSIPWAAFIFKLDSQVADWPRMVRLVLIGLGMFGLTMGMLDTNGLAQEKPAIRCVMVEVYVSAQDERSTAALKAASELAKSRAGIRLAVRKIDGSPPAQERLAKIAKFFEFEATHTPVIYCCGQVILQAEDTDGFREQLEQALRIEVFKRKDCPHCDDAAEYLGGLAKEYPGFDVQLRDIVEEPAALQELNRLVREHRKAAVSTPVFHFCNSLLVGFDREATTGGQIEQTLERWTIECQRRDEPKSDDKNSQRQSPTTPEQLAVAPEVAPRRPF